MLQFLKIARGSLSELDTQLEIAFRVKHITSQQKNDSDVLLGEVDRLLYGLFQANLKKLNEAV